MIRLSCLLLGAAALHEPGSRDQERYEQLGLALDPPARYEPLPVQPDEPWIVLQYVRRKEDARPGVFRPVLYVVRIERREDPVPLPDPPPITSFTRYLEQRWKDWTIVEARDARPSEGWTCKEYDLKGRLSTSGAVGWAHERRGPERTWVVLGFCDAREIEKERRAWRPCAERMELFQPTGGKDSEKWARFYAKNTRFRNAELRLAQRARLIDGWEAEDTENYLIVYSTRKESLVEHLKKRLEGIRRAYVELFPPAAEITAVSTVRICKDQEEYNLYGGPVGTAGYWNPASEELVLFVFEASGSDWQSGKENSRVVLFHEAFHQYIHYAVGELDPHSWFNEGYGDYFSGADFDMYGNLGRIHVNAWRIETIQYAISRRQHASWSEMAWMEQAEYYGSNRPINYAMGWSMVYFLNKCKEVKKHPSWGRILPTYFETLKAASTREGARLAAEGTASNEAELAQARTKARQEACEAAFRDVNMREIEEAWREFTLELKPPK